MAKQRVSSALFAIAMFFCALLGAPSSFADSYARIVRLSEVDGNVQIDRNTGRGFENAVPNMPITQGVRIQTSSGHAEIEFENGSVVRLTADSVVGFAQLSLASNGHRLSEVRVEDGLVYVNYRRKGDDDFRISFANRSVDLEKDVHFRVRVDRGQVELAVFKGELRVRGEAESAKVKKNETFTLDSSNGAQYELAKGIAPFGDDDWDRQRDQYLDQYASAQHDLNSPYRYGYSDLYRYGNFFNAPGYGLMWQPTGFGPGWDPFADGYWSFYPGFGYTWVSGYPWGWTPYRYGTWMYVPSYGWAWQPGNWNRWNTGIVVHNPPPTWHYPTPPPSTANATVIVGRPNRGSRLTAPDSVANPVSGAPANAVVASPNRPNRGTAPPTQSPVGGMNRSAASQIRVIRQGRLDQAGVNVRVERPNAAPRSMTPPANQPANPARPMTTAQPSVPVPPPASRPVPSPAPRPAPPSISRPAPPPRVEHAPPPHMETMHSGTPARSAGSARPPSPK